MIGVKKILRERRLLSFEHLERMDKSSSKSKQKVVVEGSKKRQTKEKIKGGDKQDMLVRGLKRTDVQDHFFIKAWLQKPVHPYLREKQDRKMKRFPEK